MTRAAFPGAFGLGRDGFDRQREGALLVRVHCPYADELVGDFFAAILANRHDDGVFPGFPLGGVADAAFGAQPRERGRPGRLGGGTAAPRMAAPRSRRRASEERLPTRRT